MKRFLTTALVLSLLDAGAAMAQDEHHGPGAPGGRPPAGEGRGAGAPAGRPPGVGGHGPAPQVPPAAPPSRLSHGGPYPYIPQGHGDVPHMNGAAPGPRTGPEAPAFTGHARFGAPGFQPGGGDRPRYDARQFPQHVRPAQRFQWHGDRAWSPQPGYYAHHWRYGDYLPEGWFASSFWIYDYNDYSLPVPPYGYEWVRYGPDALLVDTYSGEVVETVYGLFY